MNDLEIPDGTKLSDKPIKGGVAVIDASTGETFYRRLSDDEKAERKSYVPPEPVVSRRDELVASLQDGSITTDERDELLLILAGGQTNA